jgi:hypothetical protein
MTIPASSSCTTRIDKSELFASVIIAREKHTTKINVKIAFMFLKYCITLILSPIGHHSSQLNAIIFAQGLNKKRINFYNI